MIEFEDLDYNKSKLLQLAKWRNEQHEILRSKELTPIDYKRQCKWVDTCLNKGDKYFYVYYLKQNILHQQKNKFIGYCGFSNIVDNTAEMSLLIGKEYHNKGYEKKTVEKMFEIGFGPLKLNMFWIEVYKTTNNFEKFWSKLGFTKNIELFNDKIWKDKKYNSIAASITKKEWISKYYGEENKLELF